MRSAVQWITTDRRVPLKDIFWRSLITAALLPLVIGLVNKFETPRNDPSHAVRVSTERYSELDYHAGKWWVDGRMVMLDCPTDDSCQTQWTGDHWWIYRVEE